jgi:hypothetical protein
MRLSDRSIFSASLGLAATAALLLNGLPVLAEGERDQNLGGYHIGERQNAPTKGDPVSAPPATHETHRFARLTYISGDVTWRPDENAAWSKATTNTSLSQGGQIWVNGGGKAEIRLDDGSALRLGRNAIVTLQTLYTDDKGPYSKIKINAGLATLRVRHASSVYEVEAPLLTVQANGPARIRIGVGEATEVGVRLGRATVTSNQNKTLVEDGGYLSLSDAGAAFNLRSLPPEDSWDRWNDDRDRLLYGDDRRVYVHSYPYPRYYAPAPAYWLYLDIPIGPFHGHRGGHFRR